MLKDISCIALRPRFLSNCNSGFMDIAAVLGWMIKKSQHNLYDEEIESQETENLTVTIFLRHLQYEFHLLSENDFLSKK